MIFAGTALKEFQSIFIPLPSDATDDIAYEQALLFGRAKRAAGERASERAAKRVPLARLLFTIFPRMKGLLAGYSLHETVSMPKYSLKQ